LKGSAALNERESKIFEKEIRLEQKLISKLVFSLPCHSCLATFSCLTFMCWT